jgi:hypothetical protein
MSLSSKYILSYEYQRGNLPTGGIASDSLYVSFSVPDETQQQQLVSNHGLPCSLGLYLKCLVKTSSLFTTIVS